MASSLTKEEILRYQQCPSLYDEGYADAVRYAKNGGRTEQYPTAWPDFNDWLYGGFGLEGDGELVVLGGESKVGKSRLAAHFAIHVAARGQKVHYITLENSLAQTYNMLCGAAGINIEEFRMYKDLIRTPSKEMLFGRTPWNVNGLLCNMRYAQEAYGSSFFVVDHLNFMFQNEREIKDQLEKVEVIMKQLSYFCKETESTVIAISHMNKNANANDGRGLPTVARIYGSYSIVGAASKVLLVSKNNDENSREAIVQFPLSRHTFDREDLFAFDISSGQWQPLGRRAR